MNKRFHRRHDRETSPDVSMAVNQTIVDGRVGWHHIVV
jgi:hypothetical protein